MQPQLGEEVKTHPVRNRRSWLMSGDWTGALMAASAGLGSIFAIAVLAIALSTGWHVSGRLVPYAAMLVALAVGGAITTSPNILGAVGLVTIPGFSLRPLSLTLIGYALMCTVYLRRLRARGPLTLAGALTQAGRLATTQAIVLAAVALLSRLDSVEDMALLVGHGDPHADILSTVLFGTLTLAVSLSITAIVAMPTLFRGRLDHYRGLVASPLRALLVVFPVTSCAVAATIGAIYLPADRSDDPPTIVLLALALLAPNITGALLLTGLGTPVSGANLWLGAGGDVNAPLSFANLASGDRRLWLLSVGVVLLAVITGVYSAKLQRAPLARAWRPANYWLAAVMPAALLLMANSIDGEGGTDGLGPAPILDTVGVGYLAVGALLGAAAGPIGAAIVNRRRARAGSVSDDPSRPLAHEVSLFDFEIFPDQAAEERG